MGNNNMEAGGEYVSAAISLARNCSCHDRFCLVLMDGSLMPEKSTSNSVCPGWEVSAQTQSNYSWEYLCWWSVSQIHVFPALHAGSCQTGRLRSTCKFSRAMNTSSVLSNCIDALKSLHSNAEIGYETLVTAQNSAKKPPPSEQAHAPKGLF